MAMGMAMRAWFSCMWVGDFGIPMGMSTTRVWWLRWRVVSGGMSIGDGCGVEREKVVKKKMSKVGIGG